MLSFDTSTVNAYLIGVFSLAVIALILSAWVTTTEVVRNRRLRSTRAANPRRDGGPSSRPIVDSGERSSAERTAA